MITKALISDSNIRQEWHPKIKKFIKYNSKYRGYIVIDYKNRIRINSKSMIPFKYNNNIIFKYIDTFQQNNKILSQKIRCMIKIFLNKNNISKISCIGGESYIYIIINRLKGNYYCNQLKLKQEAEFNLKNCENYYIDYNKIDNIKLYSNVILNLSKLNCNLLKLININLEIKTIIIINCHHQDFWKKIKILSNFRLLNREYFYNNNYFITLNYFQKKII